jgi:hypothetical protein
VPGTNFLSKILENLANATPPRDWNAELALRAQQYEEEDHIEAECVQNAAHALRLQQAICPQCRSV